MEHNLFIVFRPLAGFWFLNFQGVRGVLRHAVCQFRPLAGFWFLNFAVQNAQWLRKDFSVPLRGSGS